MKIQEKLKKYPVSLRIGAGLLMLFELFCLVKLLTVLFSNPAVFDQVSGVLQEVRCTPIWGDDGVIQHSDTAVIQVSYPKEQKIDIICVPILSMSNYGVDVARKKMAKTPSDKYVGGDVILLGRDVYAYRLENATDFKLSSCELNDGELCELDGEYGISGILLYSLGLLFPGLILWRIIRQKNASDNEGRGC